MKDAGANGVVIGLSGGVDSAVVGSLCVRALGTKKVLALLMPSDHTPEADMDDARRLVGSWGIDASEIRISKILGELTSIIGVKGTRLADANLQARVRMTILYYYANTKGFLVAGTGDRSEKALGFFTKWGDGGVDFLPILHLYKTQVRELGTYLGLPRQVVEKPASPQLWSGHRATDEIPADYDKLDVVLECLHDNGMDATDTASSSGVPLEVVGRVQEMHRLSEHKRKMPPSLVVGD